jgi:uncharacterized protein YkwD/uncharacterized membrane protein required for colicin V production
LPHQTESCLIIIYKITMNWVELLLLIVVLLSTWASVNRGFILATLDLLSLVGSFVLAFHTYGYLSEFIQNFIPATGFLAIPLSFILIVIVARLLLDTMVYQFMEAVPPSVQLSLVNKVLGIIPGLVNGLIMSAFIVAFLVLMPFSTHISTQAQEGKLASGLIEQVNWLQDKLDPVFSEALNRGVKTTPKIGEDEVIKLPYTVKKYKVRADLEADMLVMINKERSQNGLKQLQADPEMAIVARKHAADMFERGYFSHYTPEGDDPFARMKNENVSFFTAGENLALAQTLVMAHKGLMNSPGHRANILNPAFGRVGIGILDGGIYGLMITQNFRN